MSAPPSEPDARRTESPCVGVCVIEERTGLCEGCLRTLEEVAVWGSSTASERRAILDAVARRRGALGGAPEVESIGQLFNPGGD